MSSVLHEGRVCIEELFSFFPLRAAFDVEAERKEESGGMKNSTYLTVVSAIYYASDYIELPVTLFWLICKVTSGTVTLNELIKDENTCEVPTPKYMPT